MRRASGKEEAPVNSTGASFVPVGAGCLGGGGVLARSLGGHLGLLAALFALEAGLQGPGALEVVADIDVQASEAFGLDFDLIAVHEGVQAAVVGAHRED